MARPWDEDEIAWARECAAAGDTFAEIADMADRAEAEIIEQLGDLPPITERQREVMRLHDAGLSLAEIDRQTGRAGSKGASANCILKRVRAKGYAVKPFGKGPRLTAEDIDQVVRRAGLPSRQALARLLGVPPTTASHWRSRGLSAKRLEALHG